MGTGRWKFKFTFIWWDSRLIFIFSIFSPLLLSFTLLHLLPCLEVFLSSYFLLSLPFLYFNILLLLILLCACLLHLFCQFGLYMYSSLLSLMKWPCCAIFNWTWQVKLHCIPIASSQCQSIHKLYPYQETSSTEFINCNGKEKYPRSYCKFPSS